MNTWTAPDRTRRREVSLSLFFLAWACAFFAVVMLVDALYFAHQHNGPMVRGMLLATGLLAIFTVLFAGWGAHVRATIGQAARTPLVHNDPTGSGTSAQTLSRHPLLVYGQVEHRSFVVRISAGVTQVLLAQPWNPTMTRDGYLEPESGVLIYEGQQRFADPAQAAQFAAQAVREEMGLVRA